jgi:hypothetical protein
MTTKIVTAYWMGVNGYPFQGSNDSRQQRYLGSLISHCQSIELPIICYTHSKNLEELYRLKQEYNLNNLTIKLLELYNMKYHKRISEIRDNNFDGSLDGRGPEIMWGKFQLLEQELFDCDFIYWIDAGIRHPGIFPWRYCKQYNKVTDHPVVGPWWAQYDSYNFNSFFNTTIINKLNILCDKKIFFITSTTPQITYNVFYDIIEKYSANIPFPIGGMFGGNSAIVNKFINNFWYFAEKILEKNVLVQEDCIMKPCFDMLDSNEKVEFLFDSWYCSDHDRFHFENWDESWGRPKPFYTIFQDILKY